jgi:hypothetical protein
VPYSNAREDRLHLNGPDVRLSPRMALALAMALRFSRQSGGVSERASSSGALRWTWKATSRSGSTPAGSSAPSTPPSCRTTRLFRDRSRAAALDFPCGFGPFRAVGRSRSVLWMIINSEIIPARCPTIPEAIQAAVQMAARTAEGSHGDPGLNPRRVQPRLRPFDPAGYDGSPHLRAACASRGPSETG